VPLDQAGTEQAERLAELFATVDLAAVIVSPLARAVQTAEPIAVRHRATVETDWGLADRDWGPHAGQEQAEVTARFGTVEDAPGVEPAGAFAARVTASFERVAARAVGRPVLVVAHDAVNRTVLAQLIPELGPAQGIGQRTGCWNLLVGRDGAWSAPVVDALPGDGRTP
jgi:broad specificity phosphatase PhoE